MYPMGHVGTALVVAAPFVLFLDARRATGFTTVALLSSWLPDADQVVPFLPHRGPTHTLAFAVLVSIFVGGLAVAAVRASDRLPGGRITATSPRRAFAFVALGVFVGVLSHLFADTVVVLYGIEPTGLLWPVSDARLESLEVLPLGAPLRNFVLFLNGLMLHAVVVGGPREAARSLLVSHETT